MSSLTSHVLKNLSLLLLSLLFLPLTTLVTIFYLLVPTPPPPQASSPKTALISSLCMSKGLTIARAFHLAGHTVIGVDFTRSWIPSSGKFSRSLKAHYTLPPPSPTKPGEYAAGLIRIINAENVDLWICVSGVATTSLDAEAAAIIQQQTTCKVFTPTTETCNILHDKHSFNTHTTTLGLRAPITSLVRSQLEAQSFLADKTPGSFILKSLWLDDVSRADMTLFPAHTPAATAALLAGRDIGVERPWVLQEFVRGVEYCTHAVVVRGVVKAFVACPSKELLMHYVALPHDGAVAGRLRELTERYVSSLEGGEVTGQLSFDVIVRDAVDGSGEMELYPIECNPRTHTAVVLFSTDDPRKLANSYLSLLSPSSSSVSLASPAAPYTPATSPKVYWIGHDLIFLLTGAETLAGFLWRLLSWKDATWESWDPAPFWWLYQVYWPGVFVRSLLRGRQGGWSRVNVGTTRVFAC